MKYAADDLRLLSSLLDQGIDLAEPEREAWLDSLTGDAAKLRPALRDMLAREASNEMADVLERLPAFTAPGGDARASDFRQGDSVGPYRLLRVIGHGGMGEVWLAERSDGQLKRSVALKLPTLSVRRSVLAQRFERERDILGALVHPNIARLYDAGLAEDGQPFMALEYVEGTPITKAADDKALDGKGRVRLLRQVMDAVQYAHANLVIHRDLKPDNVLVTAEGKAKLLDFGVAKLVEDETSTASETELTRLGGRALTLQYAAPEQVSGEPVSTATDVWALGVLLYELLTGLRPFAGKGRSTLEREVMEGEPVRPSQQKAGAILSLSRSLAADLDTIVMKALKKAPADRYATVSSFADDLDRWLQGEPVHARPDSAWYRTRKFVGRNKLAVAAATLAVIALIGTASVAVLFGFQAREESARAIAARDFMVDMFRRTDPDLSQGKEVSAKQLLVQGYDTVLATMQGQPLLQSDLLAGIGSALTSMEDFRGADNAYLQAALRYGEAGRPREAAAVILDRAELRLATQWETADVASVLAQAQSAYPAHAGDEEFMARHSIDRAFAAYLAGDMDGVRTWYERALPYAERALHDNTSRTVIAVRILAGMEGQLGAYQPAIDRLGVLLARLQQQPSVPPSDVLGVQGDIALIENFAGQYRAALERYDAASAYCQRSLNVNGNQCIYATRFQRSKVMLVLGYHERALDSVPFLLPRTGSARVSRGWDTLFMIQAYEVLARNGQLARYPDVSARVQAIGESTQAMPRSGSLLALIAQTRMLLQEGRPEEAREMSDKAQAVISALGLDDDRSAVRAHLLQGMTSHALGQHDAAVKTMDRAYAAQARFFGAEHPITQLVSVHRARALWAMNRESEALQVLDHAIPILEKAMGADAPSFIRLAALRKELATTKPQTLEATRKVDLFL